MHAISPVAPKENTAFTARAAAAARNFEAMALGQLLAPMFDTLDSQGGPFGGGAAEAAWRPMLVQQIASQIARAGGLGLAQPVMQEMLRLQEQAGGGH